MFERSLESLIKGFRSNRGKDEPKYIATVLAEIRHEIRSGDMEIKAEAILKLVYLQMLGHASSKAAFHVVEVMASSRYHLKFIGYLGAAQLLEPGTDVIILATNLIKKDLASRSELDAGSALSSLPYLMTPDLAQHFTNEITAMLNHSRPSIRKKAVIALHSVLTHDPASLDKAWLRLQERLEDDDPGVVSATVSILCELARRDPRPFLPLAPQLFQLLTTSTKNWVLIKVVKLFGALSTCEPRLSRRLLPSITSIIASTPAMSLLYECIHTIIVGDMLAASDGDALAQLCVDKLGKFLQDADQNLRFIALVALIKILPSHPHLVDSHRAAITQLLHAEDSTVRLRALTLLTGLSNRDNFQAYCHTLKEAIDEPQSVAKSGAAVTKLKELLAVADGSKGGGESDIASESNSALARQNFAREAALCIAAAGAKDAYARVDDLQSYTALLLGLYPAAQSPFRRLAERQLVDIMRRSLIDQSSNLTGSIGTQRSRAPLDFCLLRSQRPRLGSNTGYPSDAARLVKTLLAHDGHGRVDAAAALELVLDARQFVKVASNRRRKIPQFYSEQGLEMLQRSHEIAALISNKDASMHSLLDIAAHDSHASLSGNSKTERSRSSSSAKRWNLRRPSRKESRHPVGLFGPSDASGIVRERQSASAGNPTAGSGNSRRPLNAEHLSKTRNSPFYIGGSQSRRPTTQGKPSSILDDDEADVPVVVLNEDVLSASGPVDRNPSSGEDQAPIRVTRVVPSARRTQNRLPV